MGYEHVMIYHQLETSRWSYEFMWLDDIIGFLFTANMIFRFVPDPTGFMLLQA